MEIQRFSIEQRNELKPHIPLLVTMCDYFTPLNAWMADQITNVSDVLYAVKDKKVLGYALLDKKDGYLEIELICVGPEGRLMKGIGKKLIEKAETIAKDYGLPEIQLESQTKAKGFYFKLGFTNMSNNNGGVRMKKKINEN